jgi:glycosyltransferase involved in cell wall biosynthesis
MSPPKPHALTIVVPTLNAAATLPVALEALRPLVAANCSVIIVDGGSVDATRVIAEGFPCTLLTSPGSMYAALNAGFAHAGTEWLTWINADDLLYADSILRRISQARANEDVLYGPVDFIDSAGRFIHCWRSAAPQDLLTLYRAGYSPLLQQGTLFRRKAFEIVGGFNTTYSLVADADYWWRALEHGITFRDAPFSSVAAFRMHSKQLSQKFAAEMKAEHRRMHLDHPLNGATWRSRFAFVRWRLANSGNYAVRFLRRANLVGSPGCAGSYDVPYTPTPPSSR